MRRNLETSLEIVQPFFAAPMFFSVVAGAPPLPVAWAAAILPWLIYLILSRRLIRRTPFDIPILLFLLGLIAGFIAAPDKRIAGEAFSTTFAGILIYYGLVNNAERGRKYWAAMSVFACAIVLGLTVWFFSQGYDRVMDFNKWLFKLEADLPKTGGPLMQFNNLGLFLAVTAPVFLAIALFNQKRRRWFAAGAALTILAAVFLTASGSGWGGVAVALMFVLAVWRWKSLFTTIPAAAAVIAAATLNYHRFAWIHTVFSTESLKSRIDVWIKTVRLLEKSWFTGLGLGEWPVLFKDWPNVHNAYIQLYADTGLFGVAAAVYAAAVFVTVSLRIMKSTVRNGWFAVGVGLAGGFLAGAAASVFEVAMTGTFSNPEIHYIGIPLIWVMAAVFVVAEQRLNPKS